MTFRQKRDPPQTCSQLRLSLREQVRDLVSATARRKRPTVVAVRRKPWNDRVAA